MITAIALVLFIQPITDAHVSHDHGYPCTSWILIRNYRRRNDKNSTAATVAFSVTMKALSLTQSHSQGPLQTMTLTFAEHNKVGGARSSLVSLHRNLRGIRPPCSKLVPPIHPLLLVRCERTHNLRTRKLVLELKSTLVSVNVAWMSASVTSASVDKLHVQSPGAATVGLAEPVIYAIYVIRNFVNLLMYKYNHINSVLHYRV